MRCGLGWGNNVSMEVVILDIAIKGSSTVYGVVKKSRWVKQSYLEPHRFFIRHINMNGQNDTVIVSIPILVCYEYFEFINTLWY